MTDWLRRLWSREDGSATVEFVILVPVFFTFLLSGVELGMLLTRQMMLDRAVDLAVREVRIGNLVPVTHDALRDLICAEAMVPDCQQQLKLEMATIDPRGAWAGLDAEADCVNRADESVPVRRFDARVENQRMVLRACALFDPFFPTTGLGAQLHRQDGGDAYALVAASAFVVEPD